MAETRGSVGFGLRYRSPVGPIRIDLGIKLDRRQVPPDWRPRTADRIAHQSGAGILMELTQRGQKGRGQRAEHASHARATETRPGSWLSALLPSALCPLPCQRQSGDYRPRACHPAGPDRDAFRRRGRDRSRPRGSACGHRSDRRRIVGSHRSHVDVERSAARGSSGAVACGDRRAGDAHPPAARGAC